jgi:integrase
MARQYGSGSVYQRASDGKWAGIIEAGYTPTGGRRRLTVYGTDRKDAERKLRAKQREVTAEGMPSSSSATVKSWAEHWLQQQQQEAKPKTWLGYRTTINRWVIPTIGHKRLDKISPIDVKAVGKAIRAAGLSSTTARQHQVVLIGCLRTAVSEGGHRINPSIFAMKAPAKAVNDRAAIATADARALLTAAAAAPDGSRWIAALLQGMRQGECLGLTWSSIDLDAGICDVSWQLQALPRITRGARSGPLRVPDGYDYRVLDGALCLVRPKTARGKRLIPLVPPMVAALRRWQAIAPASPHGLVWPRPDGRPAKVKSDEAAWVALQDTAQVASVDGVLGRRYLLHEARHTCATLLMQARVPESIRIAILGHSTAAITRGYEHSSDEQTRQALQSVAELLGIGGG